MVMIVIMVGFQRTVVVVVVAFQGLNYDHNPLKCYVSYSMYFEFTTFILLLYKLLTLLWFLLHCCYEMLSGIISIVAAVCKCLCMRMLVGNMMFEIFKCTVHIIIILCLSNGATQGWLVVAATADDAVASGSTCA